MILTMSQTILAFAHHLEPVLSKLVQLTFASSKVAQFTQEIDIVFQKLWIVLQISC